MEPRPRGASWDRCCELRGAVERLRQETRCGHQGLLPLHGAAPKLSSPSRSVRSRSPGPGEGQMAEDHGRGDLESRDLPSGAAVLTFIPAVAHVQTHQAPCEQIFSCSPKVSNLYLK